MAGLLTAWRRKRVLAGTRIDESLWKHATAPYGFLAVLDDVETRRLRELALLFLDEKQIAGAAGFEPSDAARVAIAAQACLPVLELGMDFYAGWVGVIVYPGAFKVPRRIVDEVGVTHEFDAALVGEAWHRGPVVLSWEDAASPAAGANVVIHEFAHKIHMLHGAEDGFPAALPGMDRERWSDTLESAYARFRGKVERGVETVMDDYAAESTAEFFAVASEMFFTDPHALKTDFPGLYRELVLFYRQDPAARMPAR
jgi:Mlc titration factor MtfA (ptsG expression regulator)